MADVAVQDPQKSGDDPVQDTANPQNTADESQNIVTPQPENGDDSQTDQAGAEELPKFHYQFSKDFQGHEKLKDFQKPDDMAKAYVELADKVEQMEKSGEGGRVESADEYDFTGVEYPTDQIGDEDVQSMKDLAYNLGLTNAQAQGLFENVVKDLQNLTEKNKQQREEQQNKNIADLKKEFGDSFQEKITEAHRAYETLGSKEFGDLLDSYGLGSHPQVVKAFLNIHEKIGEDSLVEGGSTGSKRNLEKEWFPNSSKAW